MSNVINLSKILNSFFNQKAEEVSVLSGFIKRKRKLNATSFIKSMILGNINNTTYSLEVMRQFLADDSIEITKQGLHYRFTQNAVTFMENMYLESLGLFQQRLKLECPILQQFKAVKLLDSTYISLPSNMSEQYKGYGSSYPGQCSNSKSGIKLQLVFDYLNQTLEKMDLKEGIRSDQGYKDYLSDITEGELLIADLGYFVPCSFKKINDVGAYFISRYKSDTNIYDIETNERLSLLDLLKDESCFTREVFLSKEYRLKVRIICQKLTAEQAEIRRRKANKLAKGHGYKSSEKNQILLGWSIFITNIPKSIISLHQVVTIYRTRWQIELLFKLYKSYVNIDKFKTSKPFRLLCEFYAKLCIVIIFHGLLSLVDLKDDREISLPKAILELQRRSRELFFALSISIANITNFLQQLLISWQKFSLKDIRRKSRISTLSSLKLLTQNP